MESWGAGGGLGGWWRVGGLVEGWGAGGELRGWWRVGLLVLNDV